MNLQQSNASFIKLSFVMCLLFQHSIIFSRNYNNESTDKYTNIRYKEAFDQTALYKKYEHLMEQLGCADNVFNQHNTNVAHNKTRINGAEFAAFQEECLQQLYHARTMALSGPMFNAFSDITFTGAAAAITLWAMQGSLAGGFAPLNFIYTGLDGLRESAKASYNLIYQPDNSLAELEEHFAKNKCFIPNTLWPKIMANFITARQSEGSNTTSINFIDFAIGFTIYKPYPRIQSKNQMTLNDKKIELNHRIDQFFADYTDTKDVKYIKINVAKFIDVLIHHHPSKKHTNMPRCIYLYGSGGIGKTYFVQKLSEWIDELFPHNIHFQDIIIDTPNDLEGSSQTPGAFLNLLRHQLIENKRASIVMMDEATWLNNPGMISPAKRIFNGDQSKLITSYFGSNIDGSGINLEIPPMLIFAAANEEIKDPALKSRFDIVHYPQPTQQSLIDFGYNKAIESTLLQELNIIIDKNKIEDWIHTLDDAHLNYRYIASNVESFCSE